MNNSLSTQPNSNNKRINAHNSATAAEHHVNSNSVNLNTNNDKNKIAKKPSVGKLDKNVQNNSKMNSTMNKNEILKKK